MNKGTPLISGHIFFLHKRCPPISIYWSVISCGTHVSACHMYLTGWDLTLFLLSYILLKMVSVKNELHCHKKAVTYLAKIRKWLWYDQLQNQQFANKTLHERECSTELLKFSKGVLKISQILLENTYAEKNVNLKVWFIHAGSTFIIKKTPAHSCFSVGSAESLRITFF